jgi:hypothetical protein
MFTNKNRRLFEVALLDATSPKLRAQASFVAVGPV